MRCELSTPLLISEIIAYTGATNRGLGEDGIIKAICTDTRELCENDLFVPLNSERDSGENYIAQAIAKGVTSLSCSGSAGTLYVEDAGEALLNIASGYIGKLSSLRHIIALTGSVGKTTTKNMLHTLFKDSFITHSTKGNLNNLIGVPLTVLSAPRDTEVLICECGMNKRGEISRLSKCLKPSLSIITNIGTAHIGMLGSQEEILKAKCEIKDGMSSGYLLHPYSIAVDSYPNTLSVSDSDTRADMHFKIARQDTEGTAFGYCGKNISIDSCYFNLPGAHTFNCLTYAIAAADILGIGADKIKSAVGDMPSDTLRFKEYEFNGLTVVDDSYNASYESIVGALEMMSGRGGTFDAVIGDILELGTYSEKIHYKVGRAIAGSGAKKAFIVGKYADYLYFGAISAGMPRENIFLYHETDNLDEVADDIIEHHTPNAPLLIKASRKIGLDRLLAHFKGRL